ncbi:MAG: type II toxin-antitoxin system VapC family toxin [Pirellulales bacterium]
MKRTFVDTYFYLALLDPRDADHERAKEISEKLEGDTVTTQWVLTEVGDALCSAADRPRFLALLDVIDTDGKVTVVAADASWFDRGLDLYRRRPDKEWSLTDCISFAVMEEERIREALTADVHFEQAGFIALLRDNG